MLSWAPPSAAAAKKGWISYPQGKESFIKVEAKMYYIQEESREFPQVRAACVDAMESDAEKKSPSLCWQMRHWCSQDLGIHSATLLEHLVIHRG